MHSVNLNSTLVNFGVVVHNQHVGDPVTGAECHIQDDPCGIRRHVGRLRWHSMDLT